MTTIAASERATTVRRGRPVLGAVCGLLFGLFLAFDLLQMSVIPLDHVLVVLLPIAGLVLGFALGWLAPLGFLRRPRPTA